MIVFDHRPIEVANLFNPAFCGEILWRCISTYQKNSSSSFPYVLSFLVLPIVLDKKTRTLISPRQRQLLHAWLQSNSEVQIGFAERALEFSQITREALIFLLQVEALIIDEQGGLNSTSNKRTLMKDTDTEEISDCYRKAEIVGRWFALSGTPSTIYSMWGVKP